MEISTSRLAGIVLVLASAIPAVVSIVMWIRGGDIHAATAMFRDVSSAAGQIPMFKATCVTYAFWALASMAGVVVFATRLGREGSEVLSALIIVFFALYALNVALETTFHYGVTSWAIQLTEQGKTVPELYLQLKHWLNVNLQVAMNPLAMLAFVGIGWGGLQTHMLPRWVGWTLIVYAGLGTLYPLPLLIAPIPLFLGIVLLAKG